MTSEAKYNSETWVPFGHPFNSLTIRAMLSKLEEAVSCGAVSRTPDGANPLFGIITIVADSPYLTVPLRLTDRKLAESALRQKSYPMHGISSRKAIELIPVSLINGGECLPINKWSFAR